MMLLAVLLQHAENLGEAAGHMPEDAPPAFPPFESWHMPGQLFWLAILFTTLYLVLSRVILPKMGDTLEKRSDRIASDLDQAARLNDQAVDAQKALELRIASARAKARETSEKARARMNDEMSSELEKVDAEIDKKLDAADARIATLRKSAMSNVEQIAVDAAEVMISRFGVKASSADLKKAVSAVLE